MGYKKAEAAAVKGINFAKEQIELHKQGMDYNNPPRDFIDSFLIKMREEEHRPDTPFTGEELLHFSAFVNCLTNNTGTRLNL